MKENSEVQENFLGFYQQINIKSKMVVNAIKDTYLDLTLNSKVAEGKHMMTPAIC